MLAGQVRLIVGSVVAVAVRHNGQFINFALSFINADAAEKLVACPADNLHTPNLNMLGL